MLQVMFRGNGVVEQKFPDSGLPRSSHPFLPVLMQDVCVCRVCPVCRPAPTEPTAQQRACPPTSNLFYRRSSHQATRRLPEAPFPPSESFLKQMKLLRDLFKLEIEFCFTFLFGSHSNIQIRQSASKLLIVIRVPSSCSIETK